MENLLPKGCYFDENNIIITKEIGVGGEQFSKGFIPNEGQKIFIECPNCKTLNEVQLGIANVNNTHEDPCSNCGDYIGWGVPYEVFENTDVYFIYSDEEFLEPFGGDMDFNGNEELTIATAKIIGEPFFESNWDLLNDDFYNLKEFNEYNPEDYMLVNIDDTEALLRLSIQKFPIDKILVIDEQYKVSKIKKINLNVKVEF